MAGGETQQETKKFIVVLPQEPSQDPQPSTDDEPFNPNSISSNISNSSPTSSNNNAIPSYSFFPQTFNNYEGHVNIQHYSNLLRNVEHGKEVSRAKRNFIHVLQKASQPTNERRSSRPNSMQNGDLLLKIKKSDLLKKLPDTGSLVSLERRKSYGTTPTTAKRKDESQNAVEFVKQSTSNQISIAQKAAKRFSVLNMNTSDLIPQQEESKPRVFDKRVVSGVKWRISKHVSPTKREIPNNSNNTNNMNEDVIIVGSQVDSFQPEKQMHSSPRVTEVSQEQNKNSSPESKTPEKSSEKTPSNNSPRVRFVEDVENGNNGSASISDGLHMEIIKISPSPKRHKSPTNHSRSVPNSGRKSVEVVAHSVPKSAPIRNEKKAENKPSVMEVPKIPKPQQTQQKQSKSVKISRINIVESSPNSNISAWTDNETNNLSTTNPFFYDVESNAQSSSSVPQDGFTMAIAHNQFSKIAQKKRLLVEQRLKDLNR